MDNTKGSEAGFYEAFWADAGYQQAYAFDSAVRDRFPAIQRVWGQMVSPNRVLDFGCGNGVLTYWMHCNGFGNTIVGVDVSSTGIANARAAFAHSFLQFEHVSCLDTQFNGESFDVVVSSHVLEHVPRPETVLAQMKALGEWLVLEVPLEQSFWPAALSVLRGRARSDNPLGHVNFWTKGSFRRFIERNGLLIVRDHHYASAPYSPFNSLLKRVAERCLLKVVGLHAYSRLMSTHYAVLVRTK